MTHIAKYGNWIAQTKELVRRAEVSGRNLTYVLPAGEHTHCSICMKKIKQYKDTIHELVYGTTWRYCSDQCWVK